MVWYRLEWGVNTGQGEAFSLGIKPVLFSVKPLLITLILMTTQHMWTNQ